MNGTLFVVCTLIGAAWLAFMALCLIWAAWSLAMGRVPARRRNTEPTCICCGKACAASEPFCPDCRQPRLWLIQ